MDQSTVHRRLVKSPPELWAEVSSEDALGRHLAPFGEIRITRVVPETTVAWEGDRASGTVKLEPAGWGTRVILTATPVQRSTAAQAPAGAPAAPTTPQPVRSAPPPPQQPVQATPPQPEPAVALAPKQRRRRRGFFARLFRRRPAHVAPAAATPAQPEPDPPAPGPVPTPPEPDPAPTLVTGEPPPPVPAVHARLDPLSTGAILAVVLDHLGADHHRPPFSRS
jgi:hypothetical protein